MAKTLIKGGRVFDGKEFFFADILTENDKITKIDKSIAAHADFVFDATGKTVCAGLVDAHVHISGGEYGTNPEMSTLPFGVTAAADAGVGERFLSEELGVKTVVFASVAIKDNRASFEAPLRLLELYGKRCVGLKIYFDKYISEVRNTAPLAEAVAFAERHGLSVMVHSSNSPVPMHELLETLRRGDILTHAYHGGENNVSEDGFECIRRARAHGVYTDAGLAGHIHTDFEVFGKAIKCGAIPDIISTDITRFSAYTRGGKYGLPMCMSMAKDLGMKEEDIFKAVTSNPAKALGMEGVWGELRVGGTADISVLEYADEPYSLTDKAGNKIESKKSYRNILTILNGEIVYRR